MGCANSGNAGTTTVWKCQYCGMQFPDYNQADQHEKYQCPRRPGGGGGPAYAQQPYRPGGGGGAAYQQNQYAQGGPTQPQMMRCGNCQQVFGIPPGAAQVKCPKCQIVNACPQPQQQASIPQQIYNQPTGQQAGPGYGQPGPPPTGRKKALLVGINYPGTRAELRGCINDVHRMRGVIQQMYGFPATQDCMRILTDDQGNPHLKPTRQNILRDMQWLAQGAQPGDCLFFHYSGHGAQQEDPSYSEEDGYDETICPCDFDRAGMIVDDEIFDLIVGSLPPGCKLTAVMDCCHSGTGLDLSYTYERGQWMEEDNPCHAAGDVLLISGCQDDQCSSDGGGGYGRPMGAMTTALCNTLERNPVLTHEQLLQQLRAELRQGGFEQIPSLTSSQRFNPQKFFSPVDGIEGNMNPQIGRLFRKKKHPKRPNVLQGGLGEMLLAGAVGFMVAPMMMEGGMVMGGLMMGGAAEAVNAGGGFLDGGGGGFFGGDGGGIGDAIGGLFGGDGDGDGDGF